MYIHCMLRLYARVNTKNILPACPSLIDTAYLYYRQDEGSDPVRDAEHQGRDHRAPQCGGGCREASHQVRPGADAGQGNTNYISIQIVV